MPWSRARRQLVAASGGKPKSQQGAHWLATSGPRGAHVSGIGALWSGDRFYIVSGPRTRKSRDLAKDPRCAISVSLPDLDLVVEGKARRVTDQQTLRRLAKRFNAQGWPARVEKNAFTAPYSAPSAGRPPWYLYEMTPLTAFGVATKKPFGATRWRFNASGR